MILTKTILSTYPEFRRINKPIVDKHLKDKLNCIYFKIGDKQCPFLLLNDTIDIVHHQLAFIGTLALTKTGKIEFNPKANDPQIVYQKDNNCIVETKKVALDDAVINVFYRYLQRAVK